LATFGQATIILALFDTSDKRSEFFLFIILKSDLKTTDMHMLQNGRKHWGKKMPSKILFRSEIRYQCKVNVKNLLCNS